MDETGEKTPVDLSGLERINNLDTARMSLRWALERIRALERDNAALKEQLEEETLGNAPLPRFQDPFKNRAHYANLEKYVLKALAGKLDVSGVLAREEEAARVKEESERLLGKLREAQAEVKAQSEELRVREAETQKKLDRAREQELEARHELERVREKEAWLARHEEENARETAQVLAGEAAQRQYLEDSLARLKEAFEQQEKRMREFWTAQAAMSARRQEHRPELDVERKRMLADSEAALAKAQKTLDDLVANFPDIPQTPE